MTILARKKGHTLWTWVTPYGGAAQWTKDNHRGEPVAPTPMPFRTERQRELHDYLAWKEADRQAAIDSYEHQERRNRL